MNLISAYFKHTLRSSGLFRRYLKELEMTEKYSLAELQAYQNEKLRKVINIAYENVPFYAKVFKERGLTPEDIKTAADLQKLPIIDKKTVKENFSLFRNRKFIGLVFKGLTGGTTGSPGVFLRDLQSINRENAAIWRSWQVGGKQIGTKRATLRGAMVCEIGKKEPPFWKRDCFSNELLLSSFHLGTETLPYYIKAIKEYAPHDLYAYPSTAYLLAEYNYRQKAGLKFGAVFTSSEMVLDYQREMIERSFQCRLYDWYGQAERVAAISTCKSNNYHVMENYSFTELVQDRQGRYEVVGTSLFNFVMPLIRYQTGDYVSVSNEKCACGSAFQVIRSIDGREGQYLRTPEGTAVGVAALTHIPRGVNHLVETQFVQTSLDEIIMRVVCTNLFSKKDEEMLIKNAVEHISKSINYKMEKVTEIHRGKNGKFVPIISDKSNFLK